ncbi:NAD-dependent epimerase/dehydratase family protein [Streptomyces griseocarneus]|uniref:NAD-dependent epimerase/dehydratase family protein n=1 Tax=Streptomyces griseocarneus TaxID=51201 RepID=UPI00167DFBA8|nr:NAD(P)-dependent oxidoreductase [Streptomyces griseocarneus]MBZ6476327.1 NAD(P)-dependent oxidoreductase [Streptomyces griseocarneus]GHG78163.1 epimerase [Streptomyces griseocarneus]
MHYLLTGATGFIGRRLLDHLAARGDDATVLVRDRRRLPASPAVVRVVVGDLTDPEALSRALGAVDRVLHLAAVTHAARAADYLTVNTEGTARLCAAAAERSRPPRVVYCSSLAAGGPSAPGRRRAEGDRPAPRSWYGRSKLGGERVLLEAAGRVPGVIVRPTFVHGPGEDLGFLPGLAVATAAPAVLVTWAAAPRLLSVVHVDDVCTALLAAAEHGRPVAPGTPGQGVYQISDGADHRAEDIRAAVARVLRRRRVWIAGMPRPLAAAAASWAESSARRRGRSPSMTRDRLGDLRAADWSCSIGNAVRDLGYAPAVALPVVGT